ncbi:MAG TPA: hypothetical protein VE010_05515, partial [Thermoanaerobaculia bacterium]|nr:hypothetical protein [Thermoanaerobaculia bacterium]
MRHLIRWTFPCLLVLQFAAQAFAQCGAVTGATSYDVFFGGPGQGCSTVRATVTSPSWEPPAEDITNGASYEWRVVANGLQQCQTPPTSGC